jgi:basic membrane lipoprotein Med (substrate-binding protein (PBP1-ABC) superfamily)
VSRLAVLALLASVALAVTACGKSAGEIQWRGPKNPASDKKVALVIAQGGLGDKSYNDLANSGFTSAGEKTGVQGNVIESNVSPTRSNASCASYSRRAKNTNRRSDSSRYSPVITARSIHPSCRANQESCDRQTVRPI